jgi:hypothetical protein
MSPTGDRPPTGLHATTEINNSTNPDPDKETNNTMSNVTPIVGDFSHYPGREPPELAAAKARATKADEKRHATKANALESSVRKAFAALQVLLGVAAGRLTALNHADQAVTDAEQQAKNTPKLTKGRTLPTWLYIGAAAVFYGFEYWVDRGALLSLGLSLTVTRALSLVAPAIGLLLAHNVGKYWKARHAAISPTVDLDSSEHFIGIAALTLGITHGVVVGLIRGISGGLLVGLFFAILALALFLGMAALAFSHADDHAGRCAAARRRRWWAQLRNRDAQKQAEKQAAKARSLSQKRRALASQRIAAWDAAVSAGTHAAEARLQGKTFYVAPEPAWVKEERAIATGELPDHLRPLDVGRWVTEQQLATSPLSIGDGQDAPERKSA